MAYTKAGKKATLKYMREKIKVVNLRFRKDEYEQQILTAAQKSGLPVATFIKQAIQEKIKNDELTRKKQ